MARSAKAIALANLSWVVTVVPDAIEQLPTMAWSLARPTRQACRGRGYGCREPDSVRSVRVELRCARIERLARALVAWLTKRWPLVSADVRGTEAG